MAGYADELSLKLTAKDEMSARLKGVQKELQAVTREMATTSKELKETGSPEAAAKLRDLEREFQRLAKAQQDAAKASKTARDALKKIQSEAARATTAMGRLGQSITKHATAIRNAGLIAGAAMLLFAKQSISAFADAEKQQVMLQQAYSRFPKINDVTMKSFDDLNTSIMNLTGTDDVILASSEALLARFDLTGKQIQELIPLVNDYAIATGQDMDAASKKVGMAMLGNAKALRAMGINFKATGDRAKDYSAIMELLRVKVGGVGEAFGKSTAGQLAIANANFENLKETVGQALVPALQGLVGVAKPIVSFFTGMPQPIKQVVMIVGALGIAAMIATPRIIAMKAAMTTAGIAGGSLRTGLGNVMGVLGGPWGIALAAGALAFGAFAQAAQDSEARVQGFKDVIDATTGAMTKAGMAKIAQDLMTQFSTVDWATWGKAGITIEGVTGAIAAGGPAWDAMARRLQVLEAQTGINSVGFGTLGDAAGVMSGDVSKARDAVMVAGKAADLYGLQVEGAVDPTADLGKAAYTASVYVSGLQRALNKLTSASSHIQALRSYKKAIDDFVKKPSADAALSAVDSFNAATNTYKKGSSAQARFILNNYATMKRTIDGSGLSAALKKQLLDPLRAARREAQRVQETIDLMHGKTIKITYTGGTPTNPGGYHKAAGGAVFGPGTGTSDSIPAMLSNGEYVIRAAAARALGYDQLDRLNVADRVPTLPAIVNAPTITLPASSAGRDAPLVGVMNVHPTGQVDVELALAREARRQDRDRRTRYAGTR